jgi:hypothetical protein
MSNEQCIQRYVYTELHKSFFGEFLIILTEWLETLVDNTGRYRATTPRNWTPELVRKLNFVSNNTFHAVDLWSDSILGGYILEFAVDCTHSYSVAERDFFKGPCRRFMKSLGTWIKMILCDKCVMTMESDY